VPPVAVVAWIYVLGRRDRRDAGAPEDEGQDDEDDDDERAAPAGEPGVGRSRPG
jgi:hypothetical protein